MRWNDLCVIITTHMPRDDDDGRDGPDRNEMLRLTEAVGRELGMVL